jgi:hypothetical protein
MPKGEKVLAQSKRTAPPRQFQKKSKSCFQLVFFKLVFLKEILPQLAYFKEEVFKNKYLKYFDLPSICKTIFNTKMRISFRGSFCLVKGKAFETGGENFKS